jgi:hypothetical protein
MGIGEHLIGYLDQLYEAEAGLADPHLLVGFFLFRRVDRSAYDDFSTFRAVVAKDIPALPAMVLPCGKTKVLLAQSTFGTLRIGYPAFIAREEKTWRRDSEVLHQRRGNHSGFTDRRGPALSCCRKYTLLSGNTCAFAPFGNRCAFPPMGIEALFACPDHEGSETSTTFGGAASVSNVV